MNDYILNKYEQLKTKKYYEENKSSLKSIISAEAACIIKRLNEKIAKIEKTKKNVLLLTKYKNEINDIEQTKNIIINKLYS